jgi:hypothetical protein
MFCDKNCCYLDKINQSCTKFKCILPCNIELKSFKCEKCLQERKAIK